jgi:hypothetical protein
MTTFQIFHILSNLQLIYKHDLQRISQIERQSILKLKLQPYDMMVETFSILLKFPTIHH